jgi:hypothetical protein
LTGETESIVFVSVFDRLLSILIRSSALMVLGGWILSGLSQLAFPGYALLGLVLLGLIALETRRARNAGFRFNVHRRLFVWWKRKRVLPLLYVLVALLIFAGAIVYEPNNFDGLSYRVPKMIFWLNHHSWCWIDSPYIPVNFTFPNYEWLTVPLFLLTGGIHSEVVINLICFLLVPGLFFSLLRLFGVPPKVSYDWMWILPCGYGIALQAGSIGNDLIGLVSILAALHCARRFVMRADSGALVDAILAAAFCTGIKLTNLPLAGLAGIVLLKNPYQMWAFRRRLGVAALLGISISAVIPLALNYLHSGTALGTPADYSQATNPFAGMIGNGLILFVSAFEPPLLPGAGTISAAVQNCLGPRTLSWLTVHYEKFVLKFNELPQEESSSFGIGITLALLSCVVMAMTSRSQSQSSAGKPVLVRWQQLSWCVWILGTLAALLSRLGTGNAVPRNLLPWVPVIIAPVVAHFGKEAVARNRLWRCVATCACLSVLPALVLTPSRPLIPVPLILGAAEHLRLKPAAIDRLKTVYSVYQERADPYRHLREKLPKSLK